MNAALLVPWGDRVDRAPARRGGRTAPLIVLLADERAELERRVRAGKTPQRMVARCRVVLWAAEGLDNRRVHEEVGLSENSVSKWRGRFARHRLAGLADLPRPGRPPLFTAEQKTRVLQKAVELPRENGVPISSWSSKQLADLAVLAGIVTTIHPTTVGKWLRQADLKPHQTRMWLKSPDPEFEPRMQDVVGIYGRARELAKRGTPVFCVDEKTNIQALERLVLPMRPGQPMRLGHRYTRHGTTILMGAFQVASGKVWGRFVPDRTSKTFAGFVADVLATVPKAPEVHFVVDQLNTHFSAELCEVVARVSGVELPWAPGARTKAKERRAFLMDPAKRVVFHYTPTHASWLDQIEIWFSVLARKVLHRDSFQSVQELQRRIVAFIDHHNRFYARPYRWTYTGAACRT